MVKAGGTYPDQLHQGIFIRAAVLEHITVCANCEDHGFIVADIGGQIVGDLA